MKKLLALVLALVMTLSLCVVSSNAAYKDAADVDYKEAVDVMTAVGVFVGDGSGNFYPDQNLTRAQAAKVISYLLLGQKVADGIQGSGTVFTDVAASHWAAGYIEYCASVGVLAGIGDGKFDPNGQLTGLAFAKMLLVALGYDATYEGYTGANWSINVAKKATDLELFDGNDDIVMSAVVTRQEAAQYAFNTLQTQTVTAKKGTTMNVNGVTVVTSGEAAELNDEDGTYNYAGATPGSDEAKKLYLCEKLYGKKLVLDTTTNDAGKAVNVWYYNKTDATAKATDDKVGAYVNETEAKVIVATKGGKTIQYWLETVNTKWTTPAAGNDLVMNGYNNDSNTTIGLGDEILVFTADNDANTVTKVIVNHYTLGTMGKVTKVSGKTYDYTAVVDGKSYTSDNLPGFDAEAMVKDARVLVLYNEGKTKVVSIAVPEYVTGVKTAFGSNYIKVDGTKYTCVTDESANSDDTYNFYFDNNGYVIGKKLVKESATSDGYVYVIDADVQKYEAGTGTLIMTGAKDAKVQVKVAYMDGTQATLDMPVVKATAAVSGKTWNAGDSDWTTNATIDKDDYYVTFCGKKLEITTDDQLAGAGMTVIKDKFYNYSLNDAGQITLKALDDETEDGLTTAGNGTLKKDSYTVNGTYSANSATVLTAIGTTSKTAATYEGYKNFPATAITNGAKILVVHAKSSTIATKVFAIIDNVTADNVTYAWYAGAYESQGSKYFAEFIVDGESKNYEMNADASGLTEDAFYTLEFNATTKVWTANSATNTLGLVKEVDDGFFVTGAETAVYGKTVKVWDLTGDAAVAGTVAVGDSVAYFKDGSDSNKVPVVYIVDSFVAEQAKTAQALSDLYAVDDSDGLNNAEKAAYAGLAAVNAGKVNQVVDGATVYLSGKLVAVNATTYATQLGLYGDVGLTPAAKAAKTGGNFAIVHVNVNGANGAFYVYEKTDGSVVYGKNDTALITVINFGGVKVTVDLTGLSF